MLQRVSNIGWVPGEHRHCPDPAWTDGGMSLRVLVVDDHAVVRSGLRAVLRRHLASRSRSRTATAREGIRKALEQPFERSFWTSRCPT